MTSGCVVVTCVLYLVPCIHGDIPFNNILHLGIKLLEQERKRIILLCTFVKVHKFFGEFCCCVNPLTLNFMKLLYLKVILQTVILPGIATDKKVIKIIKMRVGRTK